MTNKNHTISDNQGLFDNQTDTDWMEINEVAAHLKAKVSHIRDLVYRNEIPHTKLGRLLRFHKPTLDRWMLSRQQGG